MLRSFKVILNFTTNTTWPTRTSCQASSTSTISPISQRRSVTPAAIREYFERLVNADEHLARCLQQTQNNLGSGARWGAASRRLGIGIKPSRCARKLDHFGDVPA